MKKISVLFFLIINLWLFSQDNTGDNKSLTDDVYLNFDISEIVNNTKSENKEEKKDTKEEKKVITKKDIEDNITFILSVTGNNLTEFGILRSSIINDKNIFGIKTFVNKTSVNIQAKISFGKIFQIYLDDNFKFIYESNDITHMKTDKHENFYKKSFDNLMKELYLLWTIPVKYPIKILIGRCYYAPETSYVFLTSNYLNYVQKNINSFIDSDDYGVNMLKFSMYFPMISFDIIYSPGFNIENDVTKMFNIQKEQKFASKIDFNFKKVNFNINGFIDTNLKWSFASSISVNISDEIILYSDLALKSKQKKLSIKKLDKKLYGNMNEYEIEENEKIIDFSGVLFGINYTPKSILTIYSEIYFNTGGLMPDEQKDFFEKLDEMKKNYNNPEYPEMAPNSNELKTNFKYYYMGKIGEVGKKYDIFNLGAFYFFTQIGKENIAGTGLDLSLSCFIHLFDGSTLLTPKIRYNFLKHFSLEIRSSLFLGYEKSIIGEVPYLSDFKILLEAKL